MGEEPTRAGCSPAARPATWLGPWQPPVRVALAVTRMARFFEPAVGGWRGILVALLVGTFPLGVGYWVGTWLTQPLTGVLLAFLLLPCVLADRFVAGLTAVGTVIGSHSALAIALSAFDPRGAAVALHGSDAYWQQTWEWVRTGNDTEYLTGVWLPTHLALLVAVPATAYTSLGVLPLGRGVEEIDLMNHYVGRLVRVSDSPTLAILHGWHPWSFIRGAAYTCLIFETMSVSLERLTGRRLSTRRRRSGRLLAGLALAVLDAVVKYFLSPVIRELLYANLKPEFLAVSIP